MDADAAVDLERRVAFRTRIAHLHEPHDSALLPKGTLFLVPAVKRSVAGCTIEYGPEELIPRRCLESHSVS